jgi:plastocyanin
MRQHVIRVVGVALVLGVSALLQAQTESAAETTVRGHVAVIHQSKHESGNGDVVVWLTSSHPIPVTRPAPVARLVQKNKQFLPHVIAVMVGTEIEFPNQDPFFHDVFSIYRGKPFDLGLYESGAMRKVKFSQPGTSYIFCNIHPQMSAAVVALPTPYFAVTAADGSFQIGHVAPGHYKIQVWYELASESDLAPLSREFDVGPQGMTLSEITIHSSDLAKEHLNKYGQQYQVDKPKNY